MGGWYRVENGERVSVALPDVFGGGARHPLHRRTDGGGRGRVFSAQGVQYEAKSGWGTAAPTTATSRPRFAQPRQMMGKLWAEVLLPEETGQRAAVPAPDRPRRAHALKRPSGRLGFRRHRLPAHSAIPSRQVRRSSCSPSAAALIAFVCAGAQSACRKGGTGCPARILLLCSLWTDSGLLQVYGSHVAELEHIVITFTC